MHPVLKAAKKAYDSIPFFNLLYGTIPKSLNEIPFISYSNYHRALGVTDCIDGTAELSGVAPPNHRDFRRMPFSILESEADIDLRQERLSHALQDIGISSAPSLRILLITDEANGPFACDLSTGLGWEGHPASIFYFTGDYDILSFQISAHRPDLLIWCLEPALLDQVDFPNSKILLAHCIDKPVPKWKGDLWLFCDEFNLIGSRPAGRTAFSIAPDQLFIEVGPSGRPSLTTLQCEVFPLVRYELANHFEVQS